MNEPSPHHPIDLIGITGSLRAGSVNGVIAAAAIDGLAGRSDGRVGLALHDVADLPLYNGDVEEAGPPPSVRRLVEAVAAADGLVLFSPEYNGSFPAVTKNVIDWLSRPPRAWEGTAVTMVTATPGPRAGLGVLTHFSAIMEHQPIRAFETLGIGRSGDKVTDDALTDDETRTGLIDFLTRFASFAADPEDPAATG